MTRTIRTAAEADLGSTTCSMFFRQSRQCRHRNRRGKYAGIRIVRTDIAVYRWNADLVGGASKSSIGAAVKAACEIMKKDWPDAPHDVRPKKEDRDKKPANQITSLQKYR